MAGRSAIKPKELWTVPYFSPAIRHGQLLFISGTAALDNDWKVIHPGDCEKQSDLVMQRIGIILNEAGATYDDVVKTTTFIVDVKDYPAYNEVRRKYFAKDPPSSSTVVAKDLVVDGLLVEVEAVAVIPDGK